SVSIAAFPATRAATTLEAASAVDNLRFRQILRIGDPLRGVRKIRPGTRHGLPRRPQCTGDVQIGVAECQVERGEPPISAAEARTQRSPYLFSASSSS